MTESSVCHRISGGSDQSGVEYRIANQTAELGGAFRLLYRAYLSAGLAQPNSLGMRVTPWHILPTTEVLIAIGRSSGEVVGTLSLVQDGELGIPMESHYSDQVHKLRQRGSRFAEVSSFADDRGNLERSFPILIRLMSLTMQVARRRGIDFLPIAVHPRHARFYERYVGFHQIGELKSYSAVRGNPALALQLDLKNLESDYPRAYRTFFGRSFSDQQLRYRPVPNKVRWLLNKYANDHAQSMQREQQMALSC